MWIAKNDSDIWNVGLSLYIRSVPKYKVQQDGTGGYINETGDDGKDIFLGTNIECTLETSIILAFIKSGIGHDDALKACMDSIRKALSIGATYCDLRRWNG